MHNVLSMLGGLEGGSDFKSNPCNGAKQSASIFIQDPQAVPVTVSVEFQRLLCDFQSFCVPSVKCAATADNKESLLRDTFRI
jgi:hypothetical protein